MSGAFINVKFFSLREAASFDLQSTDPSMDCFGSTVTSGARSSRERTNVLATTLLRSRRGDRAHRRIFQGRRIRI
jgi:hypothetical protein